MVFTRNSTFSGIGGAAGVGVLVASWFACCRKKSRNSQDAEANEDQQNDTSVSTARSKETDYWIFLNNKVILSRKQLHCLNFKNFD